MGKKIILLIIVLSIIVTLTCFMPFPTRINMTIAGIRWVNNDGEFTENVELEIKGLYLQYLFQDNVFVGDISFTGLNRDIYSEMMKITFNEEPNFSGPLAYYSRTSNSITWLGDIHIEGAFDKIVIYLSREDKDGYSDCYISAPHRTGRRPWIRPQIIRDGWVFT